MDAGKRITDLPEMESVPAGTACLAESGDGAGTRHIKFEKMAAAIGELLKLGDMKKLDTKEKSSFVAALNEVNKKTETAFTGTDGIKDGTVGMVPMPKPEDEGKVLGAGGKWVDPATGGGGSESKGRLKTIEEIEANTEEGYDVDALPVKEINSKFGGITEFIVDEDSGQITGYKTKVGADTVFPFSKEFKNALIEITVIKVGTDSSGYFIDTTINITQDNNVIYSNPKIGLRVNSTYKINL